MDSVKIDVVIPCLNEEISIAKTISDVWQFLPNARILVVDNNSTDETSRIALNSGAEVFFEHRKGKGYALARGFNEIREDCNVVFMLDGDATYSTNNMQEAVELIQNKGMDLVVGTRITLDTETGKAYRSLHIAGNRFFKLVNRYAIGSQIDDPLSGYRVMSRRFAKSFTGGATEFEIEAELNSHARILSAKVINLKIGYKGRAAGSHSKLKTIQDGVKILKMYIHYFYELQPFRAFSLTAIPLITTGSILTWRAISTYFSTQTVPNFPSLIVGISLIGFSINLVLGGIILTRIRSIQTSITRDRYNLA